MMVTYVLSVNPLLTVNLEVPGKSTLEEGLVSVVREVEFGVAVRLPIRSGIDNGLVVGTTGDEDTSDDRVVALAEDTNGTEDVFTGSLETVEEATDLVGGHEGLGQLLVVLEVNSPDGISSGVVAKKTQTFAIKQEIEC